MFGLKSYGFDLFFTKIPAASLPNQEKFLAFPEYVFVSRVAEKTRLPVSRDHEMPIASLDDLTHSSIPFARIFHSLGLVPVYL